MRKATGDRKRASEAQPQRDLLDEPFCSDLTDSVFK